MYGCLLVNFTDPLGVSRRPLIKAATASFLAAILSLGLLCSLPVLAAESNGQRTIPVAGDDLQGAIDEANPGDTVLAYPNRTIVIHDTVIVDKPLTMTGLHARLADDLENAPILLVEADGFRINNFHLRGNRDSGEELSERASLLVVEANDFVVEQGTVEQATQHGIHIRATDGRHTKNGVVRDIIGHDIERDHVSITGYGQNEFFVKNVAVERIRAYNSANRGAVEVADGTENVTVSDIYAEDCRYGVDFQDHDGRGGYQPNINTIIENVFVRRCSHAVRASTSASIGTGEAEPPPGLGHRNLTIRNIADRDWIDSFDRGPDGRRIKMTQALIVNHTDNVLIENVDFMGKGEEIYAGLMILNSNNVRARNVHMDHFSVYREAILIENSTDVLLDSVFVNASTRSESENSTAAVRYRLNNDGVYTNFRVNDLYANGSANRIIMEAVEPVGNYREYHRRRFTGEGMEFDATTADVELTNFLINYDADLIDDFIGVEHGTVNHVFQPNAAAGSDG